MLHLDFETRSELDLKKVGVYKYAAHPSTEVMCMAWAFDDEPVRVWDARKPEEFPDTVCSHIQLGEEVHAWNAAFEREIWRTVLCAQIEYLDMSGEPNWRCTMAQALAMGLPGKLERCAPVILGPDGQQKDMTGNRLMLQMSKPRTRDPVTWWEDDERYAKLMAYCAQDVEVERAIGKKLRPLSDYEQRIWEMDQRINDRGVALDLPLIHAGIDITQEAHRRASLELSELTSGHVTEATQNGRLAEWLGVESVNKDAVAGLLASDATTPVQRRVLTIRQETGMSSLAKLPGMLMAVGEDGRVRGLIQYHAAHTGRWGGRLIQPQNFPRGEIQNAYDLIDVVLRGRHSFDMLEMLYPPLHVVVALLRACLIPAPGKQFAAWDYSAIEPRVLAWLCGQLDALTRYRNGDDEYKVMASYIYQIPISEVKKFPHRQLAKAAVLGCGFGMGKRRFKEAAALAPYFLDIDEEMAETAVTTYRQRWNCVPAFWKLIENAVIEAIQFPNTPVQVNQHLRVVANSAWLLIRLPSGRLLTYAKPTVRPSLMPWTDRDGDAVYRDTAHAWGENSMTRQWEEYSLWGGFLTENIVQAVARDLLADAMLTMDREDLRLVLTSHDEVVCEVDGETQYHRMEQIMKDVPEWATGIPIALEGWLGPRYCK
jgi:DNA polymerase bacteriophage-type